ncbi:MAG: hypothetical protein LPJ96_05910 [Exiguobacterium sp.]|nr:hypothetical protein [Exiguobacterium sp.]MDX5424907.1 hypothetical protein [Exiguobacterium sp.]MDX6772357.1 hypothetical protein [Exiguobacterium sp.]
MMPDLPNMPPSPYVALYDLLTRPMTSCSSSTTLSRSITSWATRPSRSLTACH